LKFSCGLLRRKNLVVQEKKGPRIEEKNAEASQKGGDSKEGGGAFGSRRKANLSSLRAQGLPTAEDEDDWRGVLRISENVGVAHRKKNYEKCIAR